MTNDDEVMSPASAGSDAGVYFSYRDRLGEWQHCKTSSADAGILLGEALTCVHSLAAWVAEMPERSGERGVVLRGLLERMTL